MSKSVFSQEEAIKILQDVLKIKSINGNEKEVALYYQQLLKKHGIESQIVDYADKRSNLIAEISNGEGKTLGISGHMDVVHPGDEKEWSHPPFAAEIADGKLYGRGACDMKGGLTALILAMINLKESGQFKGKIRLLATVGEEIGELGSKQLANKGYAKGIDAMLIAEPVNIAIMHAHKGSFNYTINSKGVNAHSSNPQAGVNAIENLMLGMNAIQEALQKVYADYKNDAMGKLVHSFTLIKGGSQINTIPDFAQVRANARTIPEFDNKKLTELLEKIIEQTNQKHQHCQLSLQVDDDMPVMEADKDTELVKLLLDVTKTSKYYDFDKNLKPIAEFVQEQVGSAEGLPSQLEAVALSGTTDAAQFYPANPDMDVAIFGPGFSPSAHKIDEYIEVQQYLDFIHLYGEVYEAYLK
ncbi:ArgE/DapE family deacylase [Brackiella oedipodis]|uniref:ArgE/DapE family deacylase n=1 Tax=Brackiella oedipodis TaxID=124225 RepID=UPI0004915426|nr:ArgE/DapE family deacylase [Brackiella oedipodis]